jgi:hypothetical protein
MDPLSSDSSPRMALNSVTAHQPHPCAGHDLRGTVVDQKPSGEADRDIVDGEHARLVTAGEPKRNRFVDTAATDGRSDVLSI